MRSGKLLAIGIATLFLLSGLAMPVVAYTYNGAIHKRTGDSVQIFRTNTKPQ